MSGNGGTDSISNEAQILVRLPVAVNQLPSTVSVTRSPNTTHGLQVLVHPQLTEFSAFKAEG